MHPRSIATIGVAICVALLLWMFQWRYFQTRNDIVRVNRLSGSAFVLTNAGWERMEKPTDADRVIAPAPAIMDTGFVLDTTPRGPKTRADSALDSAYDAAARRIRDSRKH